MKIHSKQYDYYDTASTWQSDFHWQRPENDLKINNGLSITRTNRLGLRRYDKVFLVGFCGTFYKGIIRKDDLMDEPKFEYTESSAINTSEWDKYLLKYPIFIIEQKRYRASTWLHNSPILEDWEFYKIKDAFTAHQEIEQYLTNDLANQLDGVELEETEQQILERHGFTKCTFKGKHTGRKLKRK